MNEREITDEHDELLEEWGATYHRVRLREMTPEEKFEQLKQAYLDARERGEDPEKAMAEKYRELNPPPED